MAEGNTRRVSVGIPCCGLCPPCTRAPPVILLLCATVLGCAEYRVVLILYAEYLQGGASHLVAVFFLVGYVILCCIETTFFRISYPSGSGKCILNILFSLPHQHLNGLFSNLHYGGGACLEGCFKCCYSIICYR